MRFPQETHSDLICSFDMNQVETADSSANNDINVEFSFKRKGAVIPTKKAKEIFSLINDKKVREKTKEIVSLIDSILQLIDEQRPNIRHMPLLNVYREEDDGVLLEWVFSDFRIGFNIEPNPEDSGWHLVTDKKLDGIAIAKHLTDLNEPVERMLSLILSNT
jgi:hypothetical protein